MWVSILVLCLCVSVSIQSETRPRPLLGGWNEASENEEGVRNAIPHAVRLVSGQINSIHHYKLARLISVRKKIVSGVMYEMKMELQGTKCKRNDVQVEDINECEFDEASPVEVCTVEVWSQPWLSPEPKLHKSSCKTQDKKEVPNV